MRLSVLDQSPVPEGSSPGDALRNSIDLAQQCDRLGYHRYWVAEHHNMEGLAGSSPEVLIGHIAERTEQMRIGSGGVMLTHYSPLKVAENFQVLQALHPGRIDIGVGRAPGSDHRTAVALARGGRQLSIEYYPTMVQELRQLLHRRVPEGPLAGIEARPFTAEPPELWLLASSQDSAAIAAHFGLPLSWAHFINPHGAQICAAYREQFNPSVDHDTPVLSVGVSVLCAESDAEAEALASSLKIWRATGRRGGIPQPGEVAANPLSVAPQGRPESPLVTGTPGKVRAELTRIGEAYGADELVIVSICHDHAARVRSYELVADAFALDR